MTTATATTRSRTKKPAAAAAAFSAPIAEVHLVPLDLIDIEEQIRTEFDQESIEELAKDIQERGLMQPILLNPTTTGRFTLISGERRVRAIKLNGQEGIPALLTKSSANDALLMQLAENIQREQLSFDDEVKAVAKLYEMLGSLKDVAAKVKKSVPWCSKRYSVTKTELHYLARNLLSEGVTEDIELLKAFNELIPLMGWYDAQAWSEKIAKGEAGRKEIREALKTRKAEIKKEKQEEEAEEKGKVSHAKESDTPPPPPPWTLEDGIDELDDCLAYWSEDNAFDVYMSYTEEQRKEIDAHLADCYAHGQHEEAFWRLCQATIRRQNINELEYCVIMAGMKGIKWDTAGFLTMLDSKRPKHDQN
jgi:ParB/RepB/Spo0J family partition protein